MFDMSALLQWINGTMSICIIKLGRILTQEQDFYSQKIVIDYTNIIIIFELNFYADKILKQTQVSGQTKDDVELK